MQLSVFLPSLKVDPEKENACHKALKMFLDQRSNIAAAVQHDPWSSPLEVTELLEEAKRTLARTAECRADILSLQHDSRILTQSSNPVCGSW